MGAPRREHSQPLARAAARLDVAAYGERLDQLVAAWEAAIRASDERPHVGTGTKPRAPAGVLAELQAALDEVERHCVEQRRAAASEDAAAADWAERAEIAIRGDRDALARDALLQQQVHATAAEDAVVEAAALEAVRDMYRRAVAAVQDARLPRAEMEPRTAI